MFSATQLCPGGDLRKALREDTAGRLLWYTRYIHMTRCSQLLQSLAPALHPGVPQLHPWTYGTQHRHLELQI